MYLVALNNFSPVQKVLVNSLFIFTLLQIQGCIKVSLILISHLNIFFSVITLCVFFSLLTLLKLSMAKSKISPGKCHIALENVWVIFKYLMILISNKFTMIKEQTLYNFNMKFLHLVLCPWICSSVSQFTVYGNLNTIHILQLV